MKQGGLLILFTLLVSLSAGCSRRSPAAAQPTRTDLGVIEIADGKPSSHILSDGRVCVITPTILKDGNIELTTTINETNAAGVKRSSNTFQCPAGKTLAFPFDKETVIILNLQLPDGSTRSSPP